MPYNACIYALRYNKIEIKKLVILHWCRLLASSAKRENCMQEIRSLKYGTPRLRGFCINKVNKSANDFTTAE
jgi:hypothetical protein